MRQKQQQENIAIFIIFFLFITTLLGYCDANCMDYTTSCRECLNNSDGTTGESCVWVPVVGCIESCSTIADTSCFDQSNYPTSSVDEICTIVDNAQDDVELCQRQFDCTSCTDSILSDGTSTCQWFEIGEFCASGCGMDGCGTSTCDDDGSNTTNSCEDYDTCGGCLTSSCAWVPAVEKCLKSCDVIADTSCFRYISEDIVIYNRRNMCFSSRANYRSRNLY